MPINLVRKGSPIFKTCKIWGKINLPEVANKKNIPKITVIKISLLYKFELLFIFFDLLLRIRSIAIIKIIKNINLTIYSFYII